MKREKGQHKSKARAEKGDAPRVFLKRAPGGGWRRQWVGRWRSGGKYKDATLCRWEGTPPGPGETKEGLALFEKSRERAESMLKDAIRAGEETGREAAMVERVHSIRYGGKIGRVKIADLRARWDALPHKADLSAQRRERVHSVLSRFETFMGERFPQVKECGALTAEHFKAFFEAVDKSGVSARTWNDVLDILRGTLRKVDGQGRGFREYLAELPFRDETTVHRRPFTGEELEAVFSAAQSIDPELYPAIVAAACTALRRGDVARLRWESVDLAEGFATVKTTKTGETVEIPIFPPFMAVLKEVERERREGVPYVFPGVALAYKAGPGALDRRLRKVLAAAGFARPEKVNGGKYPAPPSPADAVAMADAGMRGARWSEARREKGMAILKRHLKGETGRAIAAKMGIARGAVSTYLRDIEELAQVAIVTPPKRETPLKSTLAEAKEGEQRRNRGSLCGWHSFRTTFCTLALANGVPMEILQKITGHRTVEIVLKHYDRRGREAMKKAIGAAMPKAIAGAVEAAAANAATVATDGKSEELVAVPAGVAELAGLLAGATAEQREAIAAILKKRGGDK